MAVTQYIGARYVPIFADPAEWSSTKQYEPLTIVLHQGNSFTSKQFVPVGVDINDTDYWLETGNFNAQIEAYRQETLRVAESIQDVETTLDSVRLTIDPDEFEGTDTEKLQAAINSYGDADKTIILKRIYNLTNDIDLNVNTNRNNITFFGFNGGISFGRYCFYSSLAPSGRSFSGCTFIGCVLKNATQHCFDADSLVRCTFISCTIKDNDTVVKANNYVQDFKFNNCKITYNTHVIVTNNCYDVSFVECTIEEGTDVFVSNGIARNVNFNECVIEGFTKSPIRVKTPMGFTIMSCYFEFCGESSNSSVIDISETRTGTMTVIGCYFVWVESHTNSSRTLVRMLTNPNVRLTMFSNACGSGLEYLFDTVADGEATELSNFTHFGNRGFAASPNTGGGYLPIYGSSENGCTMYKNKPIRVFVAMSNGCQGTLPFNPYNCSITITRVTLEDIRDYDVTEFVVTKESSSVYTIRYTGTQRFSEIANKTLRVTLTLS